MRSKAERCQILRGRRGVAGQRRWQILLGPRERGLVAGGRSGSHSTPGSTKIPPSAWHRLLRAVRRDLPRRVRKAASRRSLRALSARELPAGAAVRGGVTGGRRLLPPTGRNRQVKQ